MEKNTCSYRLPNTYKGIWSWISGEDWADKQSWTKVLPGFTKQIVLIAGWEASSREIRLEASEWHTSSLAEGLI